jgi:hypothetical protein
MIVPSGLGPGADASLAIRRNVRADDMPDILIELDAAAQLLACRDVARSVPRRVAIAARSNRRDEIGAALNRCFGDCGADGVSGQSYAPGRHGGAAKVGDHPEHGQPPALFPFMQLLR